MLYLPSTVLLCPATFPSLYLRPLFLLTVTRRVKGYTRFVEKYVTGRRKHFRPYTVYISIYLDQDQCPYERRDLSLSNGYLIVGELDFSIFSWFVFFFRESAISVALSFRLDLSPQIHFAFFLAFFCAWVCVCVDLKPRCRCKYRCSCSCGDDEHDEGERWWWRWWLRDVVSAVAATWLLYVIAG